MGTSIAAAVLILSAALWSCSAAAAPEPAGSRVLIRMAEECGRDHPTAAASREIARLAVRDSGGRILIRVYEDGYQGDESELIEQLRFGGVDVAAVGVRSLESVSRTAVAIGKSGSFPDYASMEAILDGEAGRRLALELESERLMLLAWYDGGPECYLLPYHRTTLDVSGLRIGVERSTSVMDEIAAADAVPVPVSFMDLRRALESGLIEGFRAPLAFVAANRLDSEYRVYPLGRSRVPVLIVGSKVSLMKMPKGDRRALLEAVRRARAFHAESIAAVERSYPKVAAAPK